MKRIKDDNWHKQSGCFAQPLFNIPLSHVVIDDLHLLLRVTDRLEKGIVMEVLDMDQVCIIIRTQIMCFYIFG